MWEEKHKMYSNKHKKNRDNPSKIEFNRSIILLINLALKIISKLKKTKKQLGIQVPVH